MTSTNECNRLVKPLEVGNLTKRILRSRANTNQSLNQRLNLETLEKLRYQNAKSTKYPIFHRFFHQLKISEHTSQLSRRTCHAQVSSMGKTNRTQTGESPIPSPFTVTHVASNQNQLSRFWRQQQQQEAMVVAAVVVANPAQKSSRSRGSSRIPQKQQALGWKISSMLELVEHQPNTSTT